MGIQTEWIHYGAGYQGFAAWPDRAALPIPAVVVFQEAWGVDAHIEDVTGRVARAGYFAFAPDLFAKNGSRPEPLTNARLHELQEFLNTAPPTAWTDPSARDALLQKRPEAEGNRIRESMRAMMAAIMAAAQGDRDEQHKETIHFLRQTHPVTRGQKIVATGFCMGGGHAARLAGLDPELAGAAIFYGSAPSDELIPKIQCPVLGFYGSLDARLMGALPEFKEKMRAAGKSFTPTVYEGAQHAFFNDTRPSYDIAATRDSWVKLLTFFREAGNRK